MSSIPLSIRLVRPRDLPGLPGVKSVLHLNQPEASLAAYHPFAAALSSLLPGQNRPKMLVAEGDDRILGFAQFVPEPPDRRWQLVTLGASTGVYDVTPLWEQLIERSVIAAGLRGVKRLYARPPVDSPAAEALRATGFQAYATESILAANAPRIGGSRLPIREQSPADTWAIHQLYNAVVPRQVQYAEAFTSHRWDIGAFRAAPSGVRTYGWLLEVAFQIVAYARVMSLGTNHVLELIVHPDWSGVTGDLIDATLERVSSTARVDRCWCAVHGYQDELTSAFLDRGFAVAGDLSLTVKYTAVRVVAPATEPVGQPEAVLERLPKPKRAPSYLYWQGEE